jgi:hypothetical protein
MSRKAEAKTVKKAIEKYEIIQGEKLVNSDEHLEIIHILEQFLKKKGLMCYGGLALNNILPKNARFYAEHEMPDYDVYSSRPIKDLKEIADIYYEKGYTNCNASANPIHAGSYKLFVNYTGILDITYVPPVLYDKLYVDRIIVDGISYTPVDFLRRSVYNELSNPQGDVSRFEKVYSRLNIVDKYYPVHSPIKFQNSINNLTSLKISTKCYNALIEVIVEYGGVFFGGYAMELYAKYISPEVYNALHTHRQIIYAFAMEPKILIDMIKSNAELENVNVTYKKHSAVGDIINIHYEILFDDVCVCILYETIGCHSYNVIRRKKHYVRIATIFTILHMYYSFVYVDEPYYNHDLLKYIATCLYDIKKTQTNTGILQTFPITCYGTQETKEDILSKRASLFSDLKQNPNDLKMKKHFFRYSPANVNKESSKNLSEYESSSGKYASLENLINYSGTNNSKRDDGLLTKLFTYNPFKSGIFSSKSYKKPRGKYRNKTFKYNPSHKKSYQKGIDSNKRTQKNTGIFQLYRPS